MHNSVFCIIVLYNPMRWLDKCLSSLKNSSIPISIVCIDNCSTDGCREFITTHYPSIILINNDENKGFGQANNQGIEYAYNHGAEHFLLLNQDAWVFPATIEELVRTQEKYNIGLLSPVHLNGDMSRIDNNFFDSLVVNPKNNEFVRDLLLEEVKPYYIPQFTPCAAAWLLSKQCIETIGGFDPLFFHYGEDANYFQRALYHQVGVGVIPNSFICHDREYHGNVVVYNKRRTLTNLLIKYADVRFNGVVQKKEKKRLHIFFFKVFLRFLFTLKMKDAFQIVSGYAKFIKCGVRIKKSVQSNRSVGPSWLVLNK